MAQRSTTSPRMGATVCPTFEAVINRALNSGERMSVTRRDGTKVVLPRTGPDQFWKLIHENFAGEDARKWKYLAMLALRENAGWPLDRIGNVFGHPKGHVTRCLTRIKQELRDEFAASPEYLDLDCDEV